MEGAHDVSGGRPEIRRGKSAGTAVTTVGRSLPTYLPGCVEGLGLRGLRLGSTGDSGFSLKGGFGFRESFGLRARVFGFGGGFGRGCHKIDHQQKGSNTTKNSASPKNRIKTDTQIFGTEAHWSKGAATLCAVVRPENLQT